jgi:hypothetical protein
VNLLVWLFGLILASFLFIVLRGAPYVPTKRGGIDELFSLVKLGPNDIIVDLGSGDGRVLAAASKRGINSVGYELNPFLALISRFTLRRLRPRPKVVLADFWLSALPSDTKVVFVFLGGPFMHKLEQKLQAEASRLGHDLTLVSYGVPLKGRKPIATSKSCLVYRFSASGDQA